MQPKEERSREADVQAPHAAGDENAQSSLVSVSYFTDVYNTASDLLCNATSDALKHVVAGFWGLTLYSTGGTCCRTVS